MRKITFPKQEIEDCEVCSGTGKLETSDPRAPKATCYACQGKKQVRRDTPQSVVMWALRPKKDEQGLTREQLRARTPIIRAFKVLDKEGATEVHLQDDQWTLLKKCIDEREDWPFTLDVDEILTAIEDAEKIKSAEITDLNREQKRRLRNK